MGWLIQGRRLRVWSGVGGGGGEVLFALAVGHRFKAHNAEGSGSLWLAGNTYHGLTVAHRNEQKVTEITI